MLRGWSRPARQGIRGCLGYGDSCDGHVAWDVARGSSSRMSRSTRPGSAGASTPADDTGRDRVGRASTTARAGSSSDCGRPTAPRASPWGAIGCTFFGRSRRSGVLPLFVGQDCGDIERLVDEIGRHDGNYKLAGLAFWSCVAGARDRGIRSAGKDGGRFGGGVARSRQGAQHALRPEIPVYLSSLRRRDDAGGSRSPAERLAATGATAIKVKIGGRMGRDDATPGRTRAAGQACANDVRRRRDDPRGCERLVRREAGHRSRPHARGPRRLPVRGAVRVGGLRGDEVAWPMHSNTCSSPAASRMRASKSSAGWSLIAASTSCSPTWSATAASCGSMRVARLAAEAGMDVSFHSAKSDFAAAYMLHIAAATPNLGRFRSSSKTRRPWARMRRPSRVVRTGLATVGSHCGPTVPMGVR